MKREIVSKGTESHTNVIRRDARDVSQRRETRVKYCLNQSELSRRRFITDNAFWPWKLMGMYDWNKRYDLATRAAALVAADQFGTGRAKKLDYPKKK